MMYHSKLTATISLVLAAPLAAQGALIIDPDGVGPIGTYIIDRFDWSPSSVLLKNGNQAALNFLENQSDGGTRDTTFWVYTMAKLSTGQLNHINQFSLFNTGLTDDEITITIGFQEQMKTSIANLGFAQFAQINEANSFIKMYYDDGSGIASNQLTGDGFADGTLIFDSLADVSSNDTDLFIFDQSATDTDILDQFLSDDWLGQESVFGLGNNPYTSFTITAKTNTATADPNFFKNLLPTSHLTTNIGLTLPFIHTDPSKGYTSDGIGTPDLTTANAQVDIGSINGSLINGGPDVIYSSDFNSSITETVPEPSCLALLGIGLGFISSSKIFRKVSKRKAN